MTTYYSSFYPIESADGAKGSAAFLGAITTTIIYLYKRSATTLTDLDKPNGNVIYTFATADINSTAVTNGWYESVPSGSDPLYIVAATATGINPTDTIASNEWTSPVIFSQSGLSTATIFLFQRSNSPTLPAVPSGNTTYTFSSGILSGNLYGWSQTAPDTALGKYLFATTATAISSSSTDTIANTEWASVVVLAVNGENGTDGSDGATGLTAYLTNESHIVPASYTGAVSSYSGATGQFKVFQQNVGEVSTNFTLSTVSNPQSLTISYTGTTYTVTAGLDSGEDLATVTIRATGSGAYSGVSIDKVFTLAKSKSGQDGSSPKLLSITADRQVINYSGTGALNPATQTTAFTAYKQNTTNAVSWTIKDTLGNTLTPVTTYLFSGTGDTNSMTAAQFSAAISVNGARGVVVTATLTDGTTFTDSITVVKVVDGTNGIDGTNGTSPLVYDIITSSPVIVKDAPDAATTGTYSSITIQGRKYDGNTTSNYGWITVTANGDTEATTATNTATTPITLSPASNSGKSSYTVKLYNQATVSGATLLDTQSITVVFKGASGTNGTDGSNGTNARAVSLSTNTQAFAYDSTGANPSPANTVITATALNTSGTVYYEFVLDGTSVQNTTTNTYTYTPRAAFGDMPDTLRVNIREGGTATTILASDMIAMTGLKNTVNGTNGTNGINALTSILSNAAHTLPTTNTGTVTYTGSGTTIRLYEGTTELVYDGIGTANSSWKVVATGTNITPGGLTDSGNFVTVADHSAMTASNASVSYAITGKRADGTAISITLVQSLSKSIQGSDGSNGTNARAVSLSTNVQAFSYDSAGATPSPSTSTITATALNTSGTVYYEFLLDGTSVQNTTTNTYTYTPQASFSNMPDTVRVNIREGTSTSTILASDMIAMTGLKNTVNGTDGLAALTPVISNSAHTLPTTNTGTVTYTGSGTTIRLYEGTTELTYDGVGTSNGTWKVVATPTNITTGTLTDSGTFVTVGDHSAMTANTASISYAITGKRAGGGSISLTLFQTFSKSIQGDNGSNGTNGANGLAVVLSNESHVFPANNAGAVSSYTGSGTLIRLYEGATELVYDGTGTTNGTWTVSSVATNITRGSLTDSGNYVTVGDHSGVADGTDTSSIVYTITGKTSTGAAINLTKTQSFSKAKTGANGSPGSSGAAAISGYLTSESSVVFTYADGTPTNFNGVNGFLKIIQGTTDVTATATSFSATASGCTGTINTADNTPVNGQIKGYYQVTAMSADSGTLTLSATFGGTTITKTFTVTKSKAGYEIVSILPTANLFQGRVVFLTTDNKLYRYNGTTWVKEVAAADISGTLADAQIAAVAASKVTGQLTNAQIASIDAATKLTGVVPIANIPTIPTTNLSGTISTTQIADDAITTAKIAANAITAAEIAADTITSGQIAANAITANELAANSVTAGKIAAGSITATEIAANTITAAKLVAGTITANEIAANTITAAKIAAGTITAAEIAANTITAAKIAADTITANQIAANAITASEIATDAITADKISAGSITAAKLAATNVITLSAQIQDAIITTAKIGDLQVNSAKIANLTVGTQKIEDLAISRSSSSYYNFNGYSYTTDGVWYDLFVTQGGYVYVGSGNGSYNYTQTGTGTYGEPIYSYTYVGPGLGDYNYVTSQFGLYTSVTTGSAAQSGTQVVNIEAVVVIARDGGSDDNVKARVIRTNDNQELPESYSTLRARSGPSTYALMFRDPFPIAGVANNYKVQLMNLSDNSHIYEASMRATLFRK